MAAGAPGRRGRAKEGPAGRTRTPATTPVPTPVLTQNTAENGLLERSLALVRHLREHCPWDAQQTAESLVPHLLEEAAEVADAVAEGSDAELAGELGDLLLNLAFQVVVAVEAGRFAEAEIYEQLEAKMIRRHPHAFGGVSNEAEVDASDGTAFNEAEVDASDGTASNEAEVDASGRSVFNEAEVDASSRTDSDEAEIDASRGRASNATEVDASDGTASNEADIDGFGCTPEQEPAHTLDEARARTLDEALGNVPGPLGWEKSKMEERASGESVLAGLATALDPLTKSYRMQEKAATAGFDWDDYRGARAKLEEELEEVADAIDKSDPEALEAELGDLLFAVVNLSRLLKVHPTPALARANRRFRERFGGVEELARARGLPLPGTDLKVLDSLWDEVKGRKARPPGGKPRLR